METTKAIPAPQLLNDQREMLQSYVRDSHSILILLLNRLNDHLGLPPDTLANMHRFECQSGDQIRFIKAHSLDQTADSQNAVGAHRDAGTITLLFNRLGGLQILPPGAGAEWCYVRPIPGHAIVNLGDSMVTFTNGLLRSNPHRVVAPPGAQAGHVRYSLVYFMRPDHEAVIRRLEGSELIPPLADGEVEQELSGKEWTKWRLTSIVNNEGMIKDAKHR
jgi:isopenicillin N synthase-like dioxygenase